MAGWSSSLVETYRLRDFHQEDIAMHCIYCGAALQPGITTCPTCGKPASANTPSSSPHEYNADAATYVEYSSRSIFGTAPGRRLQRSLSGNDATTSTWRSATSAAAPFSRHDCTTHHAGFARCWRRWSNHLLCSSLTTSSVTYPGYGCGQHIAHNTSPACFCYRYCRIASKYL